MNGSTRAWYAMKSLFLWLVIVVFLPEHFGEGWTIDKILFSLLLTIIISTIYMGSVYMWRKIRYIIKQK